MKGLGETLVGAYPGRALSFVCKKNDLKSPRVDLHLVDQGCFIKNEPE